MLLSQRVRQTRICYKMPASLKILRPCWGLALGVYGCLSYCVFKSSKAEQGFVIKLRG